ncbi:hypothetical protein [Methylotuvimicrobium sp. KM1]|uniref:hypothetical protein n=1 Tax=Methylotuvimicrobium sp. KM1 TaxID=3377707 RepID=UPI00384E7D61
MIKDDIIEELEQIPEAKLVELYDLIHYFRLGLLSEQDSKIDKTLCLQTLAKVKRGDMTDFTEIDDVDAHIAALRNEVN